MCNYGGIHRRVYSAHACEQCGADVWRSRTDAATAKYCSRKCAGTAQLQRIELKCSRCGVLFTRTPKLRKNKSGIVFCTRACKDNAQRTNGSIAPPHYGIGIAAYRKRALKHYGKACTKCNYSDDIRMVDVHHRDRNRRNNTIDNLEVLCVWCHALETRKDWPVR